MPQISHTMIPLRATYLVPSGQEVPLTPDKFNEIFSPVSYTDQPILDSLPQAVIQYAEEQERLHLEMDSLEQPNIWLEEAVGAFQWVSQDFSLLNELHPSHVRALCRDFLAKGPSRTTIKKSPDKGLGLFAAEPIRPGTVVGQYAGILLLDRSWQHRNGSYEFLIGYFGVPRSGVVIDAGSRGNETRFINDDPLHRNLVQVSVIYGGLLRLIFVAILEIEAGEELLIDYGDGYWPWRQRQ